MTPPTNPDGSEDVNDFLQRIRELGERRDKEDEERTKKLEDEILQGRKERQARRAGTSFARPCAWRCLSEPEWLTPRPDTESRAPLDSTTC